MLTDGREETLAGQRLKEALLHAAVAIHQAWVEMQQGTGWEPRPNPGPIDGEQLQAYNMRPFTQLASHVQQENLDFVAGMVQILVEELGTTEQAAPTHGCSRGALGGNTGPAFPLAVFNPWGLVVNSQLESLGGS